MTLDPGLIHRLLAIADLSAEFSDLLEREGYRLAVPAGVVRPLVPGARLIGPCLTLRYLPVRMETGALRASDPDGKLGNKRLLREATPGAVMVVQSPAVDVSVLGSEAAADLHAAGIAGAIVDGAVRDVEGLATIPFPAWSTSITPITGRWRLEAVELGGPVAIAGVQVQAGDICVADGGGVAFVPADRFDDLAERLLRR
ncbi:MAG: 4-hydroxy-4-methyl-2-oxoglutarate aldolase [Chloroflexota bacterium]|nr:4-hydroxy-4-methyl-2-oxoglutarate aldolase [Chloroflexota bacterium]